MILLPSTRQRIADVPFLFRASDCLDEQGIFALGYGRRLSGVFARTGHATLVDQNGRLLRAASGQPRVQATSSAGGLVRPALLLEPASTNLLLRSQEFDNASWGKTNVTVTPNAAIAPDGTLTANLVEATATAATVISQGVVVNATACTFTVYTKRVTGDAHAASFGLYNNATAQDLYFGGFNRGTGVFTPATGTGTWEAEALPNDWWRLTLTVTTGITSGDSVNAYPGFGGGVNPAGEGHYAWGAQLVPLAVPTTYIPTEGSAATRNADTLYFPFAVPPQALTVYARGVDLGLNDISSGWLYAITSAAGGNPRLIGLTSSQRYAAYYENSSSVSSTPAGTVAAIGDVVEHRTVLHADGSVTGAQSLNAATEQVGTQSAAATGGLAAAFADERLYICGPSNRGPFAVTHVAVALGERTMDEMRQLAGVA